MKGIGKIFGCFLVILGCLEILVGSYYANSFHFNLTFIIGGYFLIKQNNKARKLISVIAGILVSINLLLLVIFTIIGLPENASLTYFGAQIIITSLLDLYLLIGCISMFFTLIILILNSKNVVEEFESSTVSV